MTKVYFILVYFLCLNSAFAGYEVGNGGSVVVCRNSNKEITSVELLDVYEERIRNNQSPQEFEKNYSESANWYKLISLHSPHRGELYNFYLNNFMSEASYTKAKLRYANDYGNFTSLPTNCDLEQLILQLTKIHPFSTSLESSYKININLWNQLSPLNKDATILHEIIYRERIIQYVHFRENNNAPSPSDLNSQSIRALVGFYISGKAEHTTTQFINHLYLEAGLRRLESQGLIFLDKIPDNLAVHFEFETPHTIAVLTIDDFFNNRIRSQKGEFTVSNFFDKSFSNTKYYSYVNLKYKDYELILPSDFIFKFTQDKVTIKSYIEDFSVVKVRYKGEFYKNFLNVKKINIISNTSIEIVFSAFHKETIRF